MSCLSKRARMEAAALTVFVIVVTWLVLVIAAMHETCDAKNLKRNIFQYFVSKLRLNHTP